MKIFMENHIIYGMKHSYLYSIYVDDLELYAVHLVVPPDVVAHAATHP